MGHFFGVFLVVLFTVNPDGAKEFALAEHQLVGLDHLQQGHESHRRHDGVAVVVQQVFEKGTAMDVQVVVDGLLTVLDGHVVQFDVVDGL